MFISYYKAQNILIMSCFYKSYYCVTSVKNLGKKKSYFVYRFLLYLNIVIEFLILRT
jgi:hypothetical protein